MAIDPMMYEKYSGKKGDLASRIASTSLQEAKQSNRLGAHADDGMTAPNPYAWYKWVFIFGAVGAIVLLIVLAT